VYPGGSMSGGAKRKQNQSLFTREKELQTLTEKLSDYKQRASHFARKVEQKKADVAKITNSLAEEEKTIQHNEHNLQQLKEKDLLFVVELTAKQADVLTYQVTIDQVTNDIHRLQLSKQGLDKKESILNDAI